MNAWVVVSALCAVAATQLYYSVLTRKFARTAILPPPDEHIVILGASSVDGIGAAIARRCLARGSYRIMLVARRSEALHQVKRALIEEQTTRSARMRAEEIVLFVADCTDEVDVARLERGISQGSFSRT